MFFVLTVRYYCSARLITNRSIKRSDSIDIHSGVRIRHVGLVGRRCGERAGQRFLACHFAMFLAKQFRITHLHITLFHLSLSLRLPESTVVYRLPLLSDLPSALLEVSLVIVALRGRSAFLLAVENRCSNGS